MELATGQTDLNKIDFKKHQAELTKGYIEQGFSELDGVLLNAVAGMVRHRNANWWIDIETGEPLERNVGELLCLVHSEISEAMEGHRKNLMDDKLPHRSMLEVELADAVIRILDMAGGLGLDLGGAIAEKLEYNAKRLDHTVAHRLGENGKKY